MANFFFQTLKDGSQFLTKMCVNIAVFVTAVLGACAEPNALADPQCSSRGCFLFKALFSKRVFSIIKVLKQFHARAIKASRNRHAGAHVYVRKFHRTNSGFWAEK